MKFNKAMMNEALAITQEEMQRIFGEDWENKINKEALINLVFASSYAVLQQYHESLRRELEKSGINIGTFLTSD